MQVAEGVVAGRIDVGLHVLILDPDGSRSDHVEELAIPNVHVLAAQRSKAKAARAQRNRRFKQQTGRPAQPLTINDSKEDILPGRS